MHGNEGMKPRVVKAIADQDQMEVLLLLVEMADFHSVVEWFGELRAISNDHQKGEGPDA